MLLKKVIFVISALLLSVVTVCSQTTNKKFIPVPGSGIIKFNSPSSGGPYVEKAYHLGAQANLASGVYFQLNPSYAGWGTPNGTVFNLPVSACPAGITAGMQVNYNNGQATVTYIPLGVVSSCTTTTAGSCTAQPCLTLVAPIPTGAAVWTANNYGMFAGNPIVSTDTCNFIASFTYRATEIEGDPSASNQIIAGSSYNFSNQGPASHGENMQGDELGPDNNGQRFNIGRSFANNGSSANNVATNMITTWYNWLAALNWGGWNQIIFSWDTCTSSGAFGNGFEIGALAINGVNVPSPNSSANVAGGFQINHSNPGGFSIGGSGTVANVNDLGQFLIWTSPKFNATATGSISGAGATSITLTSPSIPLTQAITTNVGITGPGLEPNTIVKLSSGTTYVMPTVTSVALSAGQWYKISSIGTCGASPTPPYAGCTANGAAIDWVACCGASANSVGNIFKATANLGSFSASGDAAILNPATATETGQTYTIYLSGNPICSTTAVLSGAVTQANCPNNTASAPAGGNATYKFPSDVVPVNDTTLTSNFGTKIVVGTATAPTTTPITNASGGFWGAPPEGNGASTVVCTSPCVAAAGDSLGTGGVRPITLPGAGCPANAGPGQIVVDSTVIPPQLVGTVKFCTGTHLVLNYNSATSVTAGHTLQFYNWIPNDPNKIITAMSQFGDTTTGKPAIGIVGPLSNITNTSVGANTLGTSPSGTKFLLSYPQVAAASSSFDYTVSNADIADTPGSPSLVTANNPGGLPPNTVGFNWSCGSRVNNVQTSYTGSSCQQMISPGDLLLFVVTTNWGDTIGTTTCPSTGANLPVGTGGTAANTTSFTPINSGSYVVTTTAPAPSHSVASISCLYYKIAGVGESGAYTITLPTTTGSAPKIWEVETFDYGSATGTVGVDVLGTTTSPAVAIQPSVTAASITTTHANERVIGIYQSQIGTNSYVAASCPSNTTKRFDSYLPSIGGGYASGIMICDMPFPSAGTTSIGAAQWQNDTAKEAVFGTLIGVYAQ